MPVFSAYVGLITIAAGVVCLVRPLPRLGISNRRRATAAAALGVLVLGVALSWPAALTRASRRTMRLDAVMPAWQFNEVHAIRIHASPSDVYKAIKEVTPDEIRFFRTLAWIRSPHFRMPAHEGILAPPASKPILTSALQNEFMLLAEDPGRELVAGTILGALPRSERRLTPEDYVALDAPHLAKAAFNFFVDPKPDGWCTVRTETRVFATDAYARRAFAAYWRVIYPGSAIIRRMWLRAVKARAERPGRSGEWDE